MAFPVFKFLISIVLLLGRVLGQSTSVNYCADLAEVLSICQQATPSFTALAPSSQASCLCGTQLGTIPWGPATFDALAAACASQYATIDVTIASDASQLDTFCTQYIVQGSISAASTTATTASASVAPAPISSVARSTTSAAQSSSSPATVSVFSSSTPTTSATSTTSAASTKSSSGSNGARCQGLSFFGLALPIGGLALGFF